MTGNWLFVWQDVEYGLTSDWHSGGGALVVANDQVRAVELLREAAASLDEGFDQAPSLSLLLAAPAPEQALIFPDAGCC